MRKLFLLLIITLITAFCLLTNPLVSMANVRVEWEPGIGYGGPFYAYIFESIEGVQVIIHTDEWAAIPFYRNPDCVPEDFNLLGMVDFNALNCYSFVEGFEVFENGPGLDPYPIQVNLKAAGPVHIYFVPWAVLQEAIVDDELTMPELEGLEGVQIGIATNFTVTHHPGEVEDKLYSIVAKGYIEADSSIQFELKATWAQYELTHVKIDFKTTKSAPALKSKSKLAATWGEMKGR